MPANLGPLDRKSSNDVVENSDSGLLQEFRPGAASNEPYKRNTSSTDIIPSAGIPSLVAARNFH